MILTIIYYISMTASMQSLPPMRDNDHK